MQYFVVTFYLRFNKNILFVVTVQMHIAECKRFKLDIDECTIGNNGIENLQIDALKGIDKSLESNFRDCKMLIGNLSAVCALECGGHNECFFNTECLYGFDTRCFVVKYVVAEATCSPIEDKCKS